MTSKEFLSIIEQEANPTDFKKYLKQLTYKKYLQTTRLPYLKYLINILLHGLKANTVHLFNTVSKNTMVQSQILK